MNKYISNFFKKLELYEDIHNSKHHKKEIMASISRFLDLGDEKSAFNVYDAFFKAYWIGMQSKENPFLALTDTIRKYEEGAGRLIDKQRDHYVHSVNVFLLGIAIFSSNDTFQNYFNNYALNKKIYPDSYDTKHEEFFYRWGLASLFHDIAYPLEITLKQANQYFDFIWCYPSKSTTKKCSFIELPDFNKFIKLPRLKPTGKYQAKFYKRYPSFKISYANNAVFLLAEAIASRFNLRPIALKKALKILMNVMKKEGFVDHGFYSAVIMSRWYYYLMKITSWNPAYFYFPVLDSASAILLHNFYKNALIKKPFKLGKLKVSQHPIAYLLILCDELQDWNRKTYGQNDCHLFFPRNVSLSVNCNILRLSYVGMPANLKTLMRTKLKGLVIDPYDIFTKGIEITKGGRDG